MITESSQPCLKKLRQEISEAVLNEVAEEPIEKRVDTVLQRFALAAEVNTALRVLVLEELEGYGPLTPLFRDAQVTEILVNSPDEIFFETRGTLHRLPDSFSSALTLERLIRRLLRDIDRVADLRHPLVDGTLPDGTRVHLALPPVVPNAIISFRRHLHRSQTLRDLKNQNLTDEKTYQKLQTALRAKSNILICGETGSGKTTLLRALLNEIPVEERILTIEDTLELGLRRPNSVSLLSRPSPDGLLPAIRLSDLVRNSLRMRPDRLVIGEIRGEEALVFLDAVSTGHRGSMSSIHGSSCRQALTRLEQLTSRAAPQWPIELVRRLIFESIDVVICLERTSEGRRISEVSEVAGLENFGFLLEPWTRPDLESAP